MHTGREWFSGWHTARICAAMTAAFGGAKGGIDLSLMHPIESATDESPRDPSEAELKAMRAAWKAAN